MRIHVGEPELVSDLLEYFEEQADCVVAQVGETEIEVSLLGSFGVETHDGEVKRLAAEFWRQAGSRRRLGTPPSNGSS